MGAALTYARRYALFSLVGITGEDDLDAPDLPIVKLNGGPEPGLNPQAQPQAHGRAALATSPTSDRPRKGPKRGDPRPILQVEESAKACNRLLAELAILTSTDQVDDWAHRTLPIKNNLTNNDAAE